MQGPGWIWTGVLLLTTLSFEQQSNNSRIKINISTEGTQRSCAGPDCGVNCVPGAVLYDNTWMVWLRLQLLTESGISGSGALALRSFLPLPTCTNSTPSMCAACYTLLPASSAAL
jgi:hypothetical protein